MGACVELIDVADEREAAGMFAFGVGRLSVTSDARNEEKATVRSAVDGRTGLVVLPPGITVTCSGVWLVVCELEI